MKTIVCEMCDGNNFVKDEGFFICQSCETKYSVAEAKKLMVSGAAAGTEVAKPVEINKFQKIENALATAEKHFANSNYDAVVNICDQISADIGIEDDIEPYSKYLSTASYLAALSTGWNATLESNTVGTSIEYANSAVLSAAAAQHGNDISPELQELATKLWEHIKSRIYSLLEVANSFNDVAVKEMTMHIHSLVKQMIEAIPKLLFLPPHVLKSELEEMEWLCSQGKGFSPKSNSLNDRLAFYISATCIVLYNGHVSYADELAEYVLEAIETQEPNSDYVQQRKKSKVWASQGLCSKCGGQMKGLITKKCKNCG
jgi:hypothetical protein